MLGIQVYASKLFTRRRRKTELARSTASAGLQNFLRLIFTAMQVAVVPFMQIDDLQFLVLATFWPLVTLVVLRATTGNICSAKSIRQGLDSSQVLLRWLPAIAYGIPILTLGDPMYPNAPAGTLRSALTLASLVKLSPGHNFVPA